MQFAFLVGARSIGGVGWGDKAVRHPDGALKVGWMANASDSFFYSSWLQQARSGHQAYCILYTTTPHRAAYFNPLFWIIGQLSALTGIRVEACFIATGLVAGLLLSTGVYALVWRIVGREPAAFWAGFITVFSSGWTWVQRLMAKLFGWEHYHAADLRFMDLLPSSAELFYPLHTVGLAMMVWLVWLLLAPLSSPGRFSVPSGVSKAGVVLLALLLGAVRPYEPAVLICVYSLYLTATWRDQGRAARLQLGGLLLVGLAPGLIYAGWLAVQPVWSGFSAKALHLTHPRGFWLLGFGGLWLLAARGAWTLWRSGKGGRLPAIWLLFTTILLLVWNTLHTKLASGAGLALALAAGPALAELLAWVRQRFAAPAALAIATLAVLVFAGPGSLLLAVRETTLNPPRVDADIWQLAEVLRIRPPAATPTILCEHAVGEVLPGLAGVRVFAGHWALTDEYDAKRTLLRAAGLEPDSPALNPQILESRLSLLLDVSHADYLLVHHDRPAAAVIKASATLQLSSVFGKWLLYRVTRDKAAAPK